MDTQQRIVLVIATAIALTGIAAVVWRELGAPADPPSGGRLRLAIEVSLPAIGLLTLILWIWTR